MKYDILKSVIDLIDEFELENSVNKKYTENINGFKQWIVNNNQDINKFTEPNWEGKENGRSPESVISTLLVHMNRYARSYSKSAIFGSNFTTQEDFIYLITLKVFGEMSKMELIKKNVHEKSTGIQIINRLIAQGWIDQTLSTLDKRSKVLKINQLGLSTLENQMDNIRAATEAVTGNLTYTEKMHLIEILNKLNDFHLPIYDKNLEPEFLLKEVIKGKQA